MRAMTTVWTTPPLALVVALAMCVHVAGAVQVNVGMSCVQDADADGIVDCNDGCPFTVSTTDDANGNSIPDACDPHTVTAGYLASTICPGNYVWVNGGCYGVTDVAMSVDTHKDIGCPHGGHLASAHVDLTILGVVCAASNGAFCWAGMEYANSNNGINYQASRGVCASPSRDRFANHAVCVTVGGREWYGAIRRMGARLSYC